MRIASWPIHSFINSMPSARATASSSVRAHVCSSRIITADVFGIERLRDAEDVVLVEDVPVGELGCAGDRASIETLGPAGCEAGERAEVRAERRRLLEVEVARRRDERLPLRVLPHGQHVDHADDALALQPVELGKELAAEAVARERERQHLDRAEVLHPASLHR